MSLINNHKSIDVSIPAKMAPTNFDLILPGVKAIWQHDFGSTKQDIRHQSMYNLCLNRRVRCGDTHHLAIHPQLNSTVGA